VVDHYDYLGPDNEIHGLLSADWNPAIVLTQYLYWIISLIIHEENTIEITTVAELVFLIQNCLHLHLHLENYSRTRFYTSVQTICNRYNTLLKSFKYLYYLWKNNPKFGFWIKMISSPILLFLTTCWDGGCVRNDAKMTLHVPHSHSAMKCYFMVVKVHSKVKKQTFYGLHVHVHTQSKTASCMRILYASSPKLILFGAYTSIEEWRLSIQ